MKVFIVESSLGYSSMFLANGWKVVSDIYDADLVQFTGGADVDPSLYGEVAMPNTHYNRARDDAEIAIYHLARSLNIPMAGICRGAQFLNVMNDGKMYQHVDGHALGRTHPMYTEDGRTIDVTSTHHQMMIPSDKGIVLAIAHQSKRRERMYRGDMYMVETSVHDDVEVVFYPDTKCICYQPHPEYVEADHECQVYYFELLNRLLGGSDDNDN